MSTHKKFRKRKKLIIGLLAVFTIGFLIPQHLAMPVEGATIKSYAQNSFWFYPWGKSVTHKGVDIFAKRGTSVHSATSGIILFKGQINRGGNVVFILGPKWRVHYYAHLDSIKTSRFSFVTPKTIIGTVGSTGNAVGKPPYLHYTIKTVIPFPWKIDKSPQGWRKMYYLNPITYLNESFN